MRAGDNACSNSRLRERSAARCRRHQIANLLQGRRVFDGGQVARIAPFAYRLDGAAHAAFQEYIALRRTQPHFANARSVRNALDRARLRQASRLFERRGAALTREDLITIDASDIRASRVFELPAGK